MSDEIPRFGITWPPGTPLIARHNYCAYHNDGLGAFYHKKEIIKTLWPDYVWHAWNERRLQSIVESNWNTWCSGGGTGKTSDAAVMGLQYWLEAPDETAVIVCSTSMKMLRRRIWGQVAHYHGQIPKEISRCGELIDSDMLVRWRKGDAKNGIFGLAVEEGPVEEVLNNLIGIHTNRVFLILDEMQGVREAIMAATRNMGKNPVFKFLGIGNPESVTDPLGKVSEPVNGWDSVERAGTETWDIHPGPVTTKGRCDFFDGRKSPAVLDPAFAKKNPWMINQQQIDNDLRAAHGNENDPKFWSQTIGWWPPMGIESTVLDAAIIGKFKCRENAVWTHGFRRGAALDPAFSSIGGDRKSLLLGRFGEVTDEEGKRWVLQGDESIDVPIDTTSAEPIHYQIAWFCIKACKLKGIPKKDFALDSSGEGGGLKAIFDKEWDEPGEVLGVEFGGKPSDRRVEEGSSKTCDEEYDRRVSELNMAVRRFAMANGIRGLGKAAEEQACARKTAYKNKKTVVETKKEMKLRIGRSPDELDAWAVFVELCLQRGAMPAAGAITEHIERDWNATSREMDKDYSEQNYLQPANFSFEFSDYSQC